MTKTLMPQHKDRLFRFWDESNVYRDFGSEAQFEESIHRVALPEILSDCRDVLDLACGSGDNLPYVPHHVCYTGCDCSEAALQLLVDRKDHSVSDIRTHVCDVESLPVESESQDAVISSFSFEHFVNVAAILDECDRVLRPDGLLVVFGPDFSFCNNYGPPQQGLEQGLKLYRYAVHRLLRRLLFGVGPRRVLFEFVEPLELDDDTYLPDHDMTHLTNHGMMEKYLDNYSRVEFVPAAEPPESALRRLLSHLGLWGENGDARIVLRKGGKPWKRRQMHVAQTSWDGPAQG